MKILFVNLLQIQMTSIQTNDLNILDELVGSINDQTPKRAADTTDQNQLKHERNRLI